MSAHIMERIGALCLFALLSLPVMAQATVQVIPPSPTTDTGVTLLVTEPSIVNDFDVTPTGNHFRVDVGVCNITCVQQGSATVNLGLLGAGSYTYEIFIDGISSATGSFVVTQGSLVGAPTLSAPALIALALILGAAGLAFIGRRT